MNTTNQIELLPMLEKQGVKTIVLHTKDAASIINLEEDTYVVHNDVIEIYSKADAETIKVEDIRSIVTC